MAKLEPANLSRNDIDVLARAFADATSYKPGETTSIIDYVEQNLHGHIEYSDCKTDASGGSILVSEDKSFTIYLSNTTPLKRDNFTIAHELGHFVLHSRLGQIPITANRSPVIDILEREANTFAASFLMPEDKVRTLCKDYDNDYSAVADRLNVSLSAMLWRCKNIGLIK